MALVRSLPLPALQEAIQSLPQTKALTPPRAPLDGTHAHAEPPPASAFALFVEHHLALHESQVDAGSLAQIAGDALKSWKRLSASSRASWEVCLVDAES
jgi:hypothetical protein